MLWNFLNYSWRIDGSLVAFSSLFNFAVQRRPILQFELHGMVSNNLHPQFSCAATLNIWFFYFFFQTLYCFFSFLLSSVATRLLGAVSPKISLNSDPGNEHPDKVFSQVRTGRLCDPNDKLWGFWVVICVSSELSAWDLEQKERSSSPIPAPVLQSLSPTLLSVKYVRGCLF